MSRDSDRSTYGGTGARNFPNYSPKKEKSPKKQAKEYEKALKRTEKAEKRYDSNTSRRFNRAVEQETAGEKERRRSATEQGRKSAQEFFAQNIQGMTPEQRNAMQYEAERAIQREAQTANRQLLGEQANRGIVGRGGVGYAQQRQMAQAAQDAKGQVRRDVDRLNADMALKKQAAIFSAGQGEAAQAALDRQLAKDELQYNRDRKRQIEEQFRANRQFSRV